MPPSAFDTILGLIGDRIRKEDTNFRKAIPPDVRLALAIRSLKHRLRLTALLAQLTRRTGKVGQLMAHGEGTQTARTLDCEASPEEATIQPSIGGIVLFMFTMNVMGAFLTQLITTTWGMLGSNWLLRSQFLLLCWCACPLESNGADYLYGCILAHRLFRPLVHTMGPSKKAHAPPSQGDEKSGDVGRVLPARMEKARK
ncbi:hypothetical protein HPB47_015265 [Ixodes persulcatus]|uniref:Uncharacterized protein n=1 Tax=Ixodes persulcatus TaxID=34615 RepID=A0AC60QTX7_IXOPE|nr:hypothetical protein HPB47_015265 [Ixodes persulcatus]